MKDVYILGIESSCDETSVSIVKNGCVDVSTTINTQIDVHKKYGGVVPEIASRMHLENITIVLDETLKKANMKLSDMDAFASTYAPGLLGSLLVGLEVCKTLSYIYNKPFIKVNHMMGHIYANAIENKLKFPLIALILSGGHTDIIKMKDVLDFEYIKSTKDDAIGECFDKVARVLGLSYPGGPNIEAYASKGKPSYPMPNLSKTSEISFSGIKSYIVNFANTQKMKGIQINKEDLACSFQKEVTNVITNKTKDALIDNNINNLIVCGGVASNSYIRQNLKTMCDSLNINLSIPDKKYCTDNATMIAACAYQLYKKGEFSSLDTNAIPNANL